MSIDHSMSWSGWLPHYQVAGGQDTGYLPPHHSASSSPGWRTRCWTGCACLYPPSPSNPGEDEHFPVSLTPEAFPSTPAPENAPSSRPPGTSRLLEPQADPSTPHAGPGPREPSRDQGW